MAQEGLIPRKVLFGLPEISSPDISPDGEKIAYLKRTEDVLNIWLRERRYRIFKSAP